MGQAPFKMLWSGVVSELSSGGNIIRFRRARQPGQKSVEQRQLMEAVYTAGSLPVSADDLETKRIAALLQVLGFFSIHAVTPEGGLDMLRPSQTIHADDGRPWRLTKPTLRDAFFPNLVEKV
jgi:hypothetical protein